MVYYWAAIQQTDLLWLAVASIVLTWIGGFLSFFGPSSLQAAVFPLLLLWLLIPIPDPYMKSIEVALQKASAEMAYGLFRLTGMPVFRQGLTFSLPGVDVLVAEECSGIRSSVSLVIMVIVASQLFLVSRWRQFCLVLLAVPIVIFKNAVRITTLSWLGVYVSPSFFYGDLHHYGGLPFSLLAFSLLLPILLALQSSERRSAGKLPVSK
jgi:exosortase